MRPGSPFPLRERTEELLELVELEFFHVDVEFRVQGKLLAGILVPVISSDVDGVDVFGLFQVLGLAERFGIKAGIQCLVPLLVDDPWFAVQYVILLRV